MFRPIFCKITAPTRRELSSEEEKSRHLVRVLTAALENSSLLYLYFVEHKSIIFIVHLDLDISQFNNSKDQFRKHIKSAKINLGRISLPTTIVDKCGRVLLWYLPQILTRTFHVSTSVNICCNSNTRRTRMKF